MIEVFILPRLLWFVLYPASWVGVALVAWYRPNLWLYLGVILVAAFVVMLTVPEERKGKDDPRAADCDCNRCTERTGGDTWDQQTLF